MTAAQSGIWYAQQLNPQNTIFLLGEYLDIEGPLDTELVEEALRHVVEEADTLRVRFEQADGEPTQRVVPAADFAFEPVRLDFTTENDPQEAARAWMAAELDRPVDPLRDPLFLFALLKVGEERHFWFYRYHHLLADGYTVVVIAQRVPEIYSALASGLPVGDSPFAPLTDLLDEHAAYQGSERRVRDRDHWAERMADAPEPVSLSGRQPGAVFELVHRTAHLPQEETDRLRNLGRAAETSWPPVLFASVAAYLQRLTGEREVILGLPVSNRLGRTALSVPSMVSNVLPLRIAFPDGVTVAELMHQVSAELRGATRHQRYPYEDIRQDLGMLAADRRLVGPHVNLMMFDHKLSFGEVPSRPCTLATGPTDDLSFLIYDRTTEAGLQIDCDANADLYDEVALEAYQEGFLTFLRELSKAGPHQRVDALAVSDRAQQVRDGARAALAAGQESSRQDGVPEPSPAGAAPAHRPRTPQEEIVCALAAEVFETEKVEVDDNFFLIGGRSLHITKLVSKVRKAFKAEIPLRSVFENPTVAGLVEQLAGARGARQPLVAAERPAEIPLSPAQQRLWFLNQLGGQDSVYNEAVAIRLRGKPDTPALRAALNDVVARHESLRTIHPEADGQARQLILDPVAADVALPVVPVTWDRLPAALAEEAREGFDLGAEIPVRARLLVPAEDECVLQLVVHHIACDGWSVTPFTRDLSVAYAARCAGREPVWEPLPVQYADYVLWQRDLLGDAAEEGSELARQLRYWREALDGLPEEIALPIDRPRPAVATHDGGRVPFELPARTHEQLRELAADSGASLFMVVQAGLAALLSRFGAGSDIPIGSLIAGRTDAALDDLVGFFVNTLVLRTDTSGDPTFRELLDRVRESDLAAYAHQDLSFERLVEEINPARSLARHPLFQTALDVQSSDGSRLDLAGLEAESELMDTGSARFDLFFRLVELRDGEGGAAGVSGRLEFARDLFDEETARRLAAGLVRLLKAVAADPRVRVGELDVLSAVERGWVVEGWNATDHTVTPGTLVSGFEEQVARTPDAPAVLFEDQAVTYAELDTRANQLAHALVARGVGPGTFVAVAAPRSVELVTALYAVLKAGAAYVPVDPDYPADRISTILQDATPALLLTTTNTAPQLPTTPVPQLLLDTDQGRGTEHPAHRPDVTVAPNAPAYVIFTSGSTGRPKGVVVGHDAINNRLAWMQDTYQLDTTDRVLQKTPSGFDVSVWEFFWPLRTGATLVLARPEGHKDPAYLTTLIQNTGITTAHFVPSMLQAFLTEPTTPHCTTLRRIISSGEALPTDTAHRFHTQLPTTQLHNLYGPTEAAVDVTAHHTTTTSSSGSDTTSSGGSGSSGSGSGSSGGSSSGSGGGVPIGRPIWNTRTYILDNALRPVPVGVPGELYLAGIQLAHGYTHRPALTAERFTANPHSTTGERMYRTGDIARWTTDGTIEYQGRSDDQIKLRGFRIELGDIETALTTHPHITHTTVLLREDQPGNKQLIAYTLPTPGHTPHPDQLRTHAATHLPDHMIPAAFITLTELPLTANGKLDRKALPAPDFSRQVVGRSPRNPREELLCTLFAETLNLDTVTIDDNFFNLGGDSIVSIQLVSRARAAGLVFTPRDVFQQRTVEALAAIAVASDGSAVDTPNDPEAGTGDLPATPIIHWLSEAGGEIDGFYQAMVVRTPATATVETLTTTLQSLIDHHDILRLRTTRTEGRPWTFTVRPKGDVDAAWILRRVDTAGVHGGELRSLMAKETKPAQDALAPDDGVVLQAVWFDGGPGVEGRLLLMAHHLVVDGVSWRILLPDLATAHDAAEAGREPDFGQPGTSYRGWAQGLVEAASTEARTAELDTWTAMLGAEDPLLGNRPLDPDRDTAATSRALSVELPPHLTEPLLTTVPAVFHAGVNDILLTGFALAVADWRRRRGQNTTGTLIDLEGHGREELVPGTDISRTIGWFTSLYPVHLSPGVTEDAWEEIRTGGPAVGNAVKSIKEQLRALPDNGAGYGLLRHLNPDTAPTLAALPTPQISFNYLGRFELAGKKGGSGGTTAWSPAPEADSGVSGGSDDGMRLRYAFVLSAAAIDGPDGPTLTAGWSWPRELIDEEDVRDLAESWFRALEAIVTHAEGPDAGGRTASDFSLGGLSQDEIAEFEDDFLL
nr:non-ribosomal peptide synthetase [Streptomyces sp. SID14515]